MDQKKQAQMKQQIAQFMRKKDYYDILGLNKQCNETDIKKAYKRLALRFHPDKNKVQGSKQVFKKVSNAYTTLSNPEKKQRYDRFGPEQDLPTRNQNRYQQGQYQDQQFDQMDDIFRAFFGGGFAGGAHVRFNRGRQFNFNMGGNRPQQAGANQGGFNISYLFFFLVIIYMIAPMFKSRPYYSLNPSTQYRFKMQSQFIGAPYYVRQQFFHANTEPSFKKSIDETIDYQYITKLNQNCDQAIRTKKSYQYQAYQYQPGQYRDSLLRKAFKIDQSSCIRLQQIKTNYPEYIKNLFYYY